LSPSRVAMGKTTPTGLIALPPRCFGVPGHPAAKNYIC